MFDSGVPAVKPAKNQAMWPFYLGLVLFILGGLAFFSLPETPERVIRPDGPQEVHIVADDTNPTKTPTVVICEPGMEVGTICRFNFTPTPMSNCPPTNNGSLCIYTGVENFREKK